MHDKGSLCHSSNNAARPRSVRGQVSAAREFDRWKRWDSFHGPPASQAPRIAEDYRGHIPAQSQAWEKEDLWRGWWGGRGGMSHYFNETGEDENLSYAWEGSALIIILLIKSVWLL